MEQEMDDLLFNLSCMDNSESLVHGEWYYYIKPECMSIMKSNIRYWMRLVTNKVVKWRKQVVMIDCLLFFSEVFVVCRMLVSSRDIL